MSDREDPTSLDGGGGVRERILEAALALLSEDGISELSQVQVARRAGIRQSHLTYYFPRRHDLISAITECVVDEMACDVRGALSESEDDGAAAMLNRLADAIAQRGHMRMFIGAIVEADHDSDVRAILMRETERLRAALTEALGGRDAAERARFILASLWGLGLYAFLAGTPAASPSTRAGASFLARLVEGGTAAEET